jgi:hypothetical protein
MRRRLATVASDFSADPVRSPVATTNDRRIHSGFGEDNPTNRWVPNGTDVCLC